MSNELSIIGQKEIENRIFTFRSVQVMIDRDLAEMYGVETKVLNQSVKRNIERFPEIFRFQLIDSERDELVTNCDRFEKLKHSSTLPYAFSEQGVAMLSAVLHSQTAVKVSIMIMNAFVEMRKMVLGNAALFQRLDKLEIKQIESDHKFDQIFKALESRSLQQENGIFFEGQIFDAYAFASKLIKQAKHSIILIDNYVDESVLILLSKRASLVNATIYTNQRSNQFELDLKKYNQQYPSVTVVIHTTSHDRFLIIDEKELYHIGASLKDLGKKWFAFSRMDSFISQVISKLI